MLEEADGRVLGSAPDVATTIGVLTSPDREWTIHNYVQTCFGECAEFFRDGCAITVDNCEDGTVLGPPVSGDVTGDMVILQEEQFGPILGLAPVADLDEAITRLDRSEFGNAARLYTDRGSEARRFRNRTEAGNLGGNVGTVAAMAFFHVGGHESSFFGDLHAQDEDMIRIYTDETVSIERWPDE